MNIAHARLTNQSICNPQFSGAADAVSWMGAMQAQDYPGALWSIGLRMAQAVQSDVERTVAEGTIVRTWPMRGTLHFVAAEDVKWMLRLLTPRVIARNARRYRQLELSEETFIRCKAVLSQNLRDGRHLSRDEIYQHLERAHIATTGQRGYHLLLRCAQDGLICFGAPRDGELTYTLLDEWVPQTKQLAGDEALAELTRRYFKSHGPATLPDLVRWAGITRTDAKRGLEAVRSELVQETVADQIYWLSPNFPRADCTSHAAFLLPGFDEYLLGYGDRSAVLDPAYARHICPGGNGVFRPTIVIGGQVVGTWKRTLRKKKALITPDPFQTLTGLESEAFADAVARYAKFVGLTVVPA